MGRERRGLISRAPFRTLLLALFFSGAPVAASGATILGFAEFARQSKTIVSGTVERVWVDTDRRVHMPVVRVVIRDVHAVRGPKTDRVLISSWKNERDAASPEARDFQKGERYIFMVPESLGDEGAPYAPIVGLNGGLFPVLYDPSRRMNLVHDFARRPVARIAQDHLLVVDAVAGASRPARERVLSRGPRIKVLPAAEDPGSRVSEEVFLRIVRDLSFQ